ncbi:MAG TPA: hypothetical protein VLJ18_08020 [Thermoanaerobaculia bacterium]|nr:hypothetical protein [Thermoanaerobaculia bacterium]
MTSPRALAMLGLVLGLAGSSSKPAHSPVVSFPARAVRKETWSPIATVGAPASLWGHLAVWTGTEMIVWGGNVQRGSGYEIVNTGALYDPASDTWRPMSDVGAPSVRSDATAVWTGTEMIVWGGFGLNEYQNSGVRYDPALDAWRPMATPEFLPGRVWHSAVWTGSHMIVWGGMGQRDQLLSDGGAYDPVNDSWTPLAQAPLGGRRSHAAVWTGGEMIIWGGVNVHAPDSFGLTGTGLRFDPKANAWTRIADVGRPAGAIAPKAVWTGSHMIVVSLLEGPVFGDLAGGFSASYEPAMDLWEALPRVVGFDNSCMWPVDLPVVWTGGSLVLFSNGSTRYEPARGEWFPLVKRGQPIATCFSQTVVWTGSQMIVWGPGPEYSGIWTPGR